MLRCVPSVARSFEGDAVCMSDGCHAESAGGGGEEVVILPVVPHPHRQHGAAHRGGPLNKVITWFPTVLPLFALHPSLSPYFSPLFFPAVSSLCVVFLKIHFLLFPYCKFARFVFTLQVAMKKFSHKLSALVRPERSLFCSALPHRFLERELSRMIPSSPPKALRIVVKCTWAKILHLNLSLQISAVIRGSL